MGKVVSSTLNINKNVNFEVNTQAPSTKINIRLHNGESIVQEFNLTNTVNDIITFVKKVAPVSGSFQLIEGFPPKPLTDMNKSIDELKLSGTTLTQRLT